MNKQTILFFLFLLLSVPGKAQWRFSGGTVQFSIKNAGLRVEGKFTGIQARVEFDPARPETAVLFASVDANTIETGIKLRDKHLKKEEYFFTDKYPQINLSLVNLIKRQSDWLGRFNLTLKGTTRTVEIPLVFAENGKSASLSGKFTLNRLDYQVGGNSWTMGDEVKINVSANLFK